MTTYLRIRPAYWHGAWVGFQLEAGGEPVGKVYGLYKHAALVREQLL